MCTGKDATSGDLTALTDKFVKANGRLHELQKQQTELQAKLANDYGLEEAFGALVDKCYEAQVPKTLKFEPQMWHESVTLPCPALLTGPLWVPPVSIPPPCGSQGVVRCPLGSMRWE